MMIFYIFYIITKIGIKKGYPITNNESRKPYNFNK